MYLEWQRSPHLGTFGSFYSTLLLNPKANLLSLNIKLNLGDKRVFLSIANARSKKNSFCHRVIPVLNSLSQEVVVGCTINQFKNMIISGQGRNVNLTFTIAY